MAQAPYDERFGSKPLKAADKLREWREHPSVYVRETWPGTEPDPIQEDILETFPHHPKIALQSCTGSGKLQPYSMEIETLSGLKRWGDLKPGDLVFAQDGSPAKIIARHEQGVVPIYRVTFDDGSSTRCGLDHLWKVRGRTERRHLKENVNPSWAPAIARMDKARTWMKNSADGYVVLTTQQIIDRGVKLASHNGRNQFEIPRQSAAQFERASQPIDPYIVGIWIGDGSKGVPSYCKPYLEVEEEINRRGYKTNRGNDGKQVYISLCSKKFAELDCYSFGSHERFIPQNYKYASISQRTDLLCGLMDSDGCIGDCGALEYSTTSERLANDVVWIVRSLGGNALIKESLKEGWYRNSDGERVDCRDCYRVTVVLPFNPFKIKHKAERWKDPARSPKSLRYMTRFIVSIEPDGEEESMCIEVDHPSHCYLANDFIVTHNTTSLSWLAWNFFETRPHPHIGVTSISGDNLKTGLWRELAKWRNKSPRLMTIAEQTNTKIYLKEHPGTWSIEARTWAKDANPDQIGTALAGFHEDYVLWLADETGGFPDSVMPVMEAIFSGSPKEARIVQAGNPTHLSGPLYRAATSAREFWKVFEITADPDSPRRSGRISIDHAREQIAQWGIDHDYVRVRILGKFPSQSFNSLIGPDEVTAAMKRYYPEDQVKSHARILGVDVAAEGDDASVICPRQGLQVYNFMVQRNLLPEQGGSWVARKWDDWGADACFVDSTGGFGAGWNAELRRLGKSPFGVHFSSKAHDDAQFYNKRTEMYWDAVQWIRQGGALPDDPQLVSELAEATYIYKDGRILLEPKALFKKRLGRSPDKADSFVISFAEPITPRAKGVTARKQNAEAYDPFASMSHASSVAASYDPFR